MHSPFGLPSAVFLRYASILFILSKNFRYPLGKDCTLINIYAKQDLNS